MAWNGSIDKGGDSAQTSAKKRAKARKPSPLRGVVAGVFVVAIVGFSITFFCLNRHSPTVAIHENAKTNAVDGSVTRVVKHIKNDSPAPGRSQEPSREIVSLPSVSNDDGVEAVSSNAIDVSSLDDRVKSQRNRPLKSHMEQLISMAVPSTPGGMVPPLPIMSGEAANEEENVKAEIADIQRGFANELKADDSDSDAMLERKEVVSIGKDEFKQLMKEGYTLRQYVEALRERYNDDAEFLNEAKKIMDETLDDATVSDEDCQAMKAKIDKLLSERGMQPLDSSYDLNVVDPEHDTIQGVER